jgi:hypothetical protein
VFPFCPFSKFKSIHKLVSQSNKEKMSAPAQDPAVPAAPPASKNASKKANANWDTVLVRALIRATLKHLAYKRTPVKFDDKWAKVADDLSTNPSLTKHLSNVGALNGQASKKKWLRMKGAIETKDEVFFVPGRCQSFWLF